jgi:hypothetical protein
MASWFSKQALDWFAEQHAHLPRESTVNALFAEELVCRHCCERLPLVLFTTVNNEHFDEDGQCRKRTRRVGDVQKWIPNEAVREGYLFGVDVGLKQTQSGSTGSSAPDVGEPQPVEPAPRPVCCSDCGERIVDAYHFDRSGRCSKRPARPVCTCGQTVWNDARHYGEPVCADCRMQALHNSEIEHAPQQPIDARISAAQRSEPARDAADWDCWSTAGDES